MEGGELHFEMVPQPAFDRASGPDAQPYSLTRGGAVSIPYTTQSVSLFTEPVDVALATTTPGARNSLYARRLGARFALGALPGRRCGWTVR